MKNRTPVAVTIAGSDSGGGAGLQIDLKVFASLGVFGATVVTALTVQNSVGVRAVKSLPTDLVDAQLEAILDDFSPGAIKTGMLWTAANVGAIARRLSALPKSPPLVVDPVIWAGEGSRLLSERGVRRLTGDLLPLATVITPNRQEAAHLCGFEISGVEEAKSAAEKLTKMGAKAALVKGGHLPGRPVDVFFDGSEFEEFEVPRRVQGVTHGTGCALAAAIAAHLAKGYSPKEAARKSHAYLQNLIHKAEKLGKGSRLLIPGAESSA